MPTDPPAHRVSQLGPRSAWHPLVLLPLALTAWVYHPITRVFFYADDFVHLADIVNDGPLIFLLKPFGGHAFLARNLVFLASYELFGVDPVRFQWTVLLVHLVNVGLLFGVLRILTGSAWLACLVATVWGTAPLALGSLGWYAAFGHVLLGTTLLIVLLGVSRVVSTRGVISTRAAVCWYLILLVGSTCYGPGMGVAAVFPAALLLLPVTWERRVVRLLFLSLPVATFALYFGLQRLYIMLGRGLSMEEEIHQLAARGGFETIPPLFAHLLAYSASATALGFFQPRGYPNAASWITVAGLAAGVSLFLWRADRETRRIALAMAVVWAGPYFMIAAGRGHMYALYGVPATTAAAIGRYHYAGTIPLVLLVGLMVQQVGRRPGLATIPRWLVVAFGVGLLGYGYERAGFRIDERPFGHDLFLTARKEVDAALAAAPPGSTIYLENESNSTVLLGPAIPNRLFPGRAAVFLVTHPAGWGDGREVRFVERDRKLLDWYRNREPTPLGQLLVAPEEVPPTP